MCHKSVIDTWIPQALHVLDRFHVVRWFTAVQRDIQRREDGTQPAFDPDVFRARFALLRRGDQLSNTQAAHIDNLFADHPRLRTAWNALQELYGLNLAEDHNGSLQALGRFADLYATGELPDSHKVVDTVIAWGDEILAWHQSGRPSNGRLEGTNKLPQVLRRVALGFTNPNNYAARGLLLV